MIPLLLTLTLTAGAQAPGDPADALQATITVQKKSGKLLFEHIFPAAAPDGATHIFTKGEWTWTAILYRQIYDQRVETCVDVQRLHPRKEREELGRPCVVVEGRQTPGSQARTQGGKFGLVLAVER